eukprot:CCRYP_006473-RB/>CCRYP_006473-RB protein AED:0.02 eAED:0.02 QI:690/1/1/1/0.5/0.4/5/239/1470
MSHTLYIATCTFILLISLGQEDILVAIVKGRRVCVRLKLNVTKLEAHSRAGIAETKEAGEDKEAPDARPKRKRNNLYSSLSPAVMRATEEERAKTYSEAPQLLRRQPKTSLFPAASLDPKDVHPAVLDAETAAQASGGKVPQEYLGYDGNLFYCRVCLGVGEVVCCDNCPSVFHPACIPKGLSKTSLDNDDDPWYCPECVENGMHGKSIHQPKKKRKNLKIRHPDDEKQDIMQPSPPRRNKKRCRTCSKKAVENFPLVECSGEKCISLIHFPGCPDRVQEDDYVYVHPTIGPLCSLCRCEVLRDESRNDRKIEHESDGGNAPLQIGQEKVKSGRSAGRGGGKGGRGSGKGGRGQVSNGGRGSHKNNSPPKEHGHPPDPSEALASSGYQAPYIEYDGDDVGPESLAIVEKPTESIPAFFFFLINNRHAIEKSLHRKSRLFRGMPKGLSRNEKVAEEGAATWLGLTDQERRAWIDVAINDFQDRVVAWKEKEAIDAMMQGIDGEHDNDRKRPNVEPDVSSVVLTSEDERHATDSRVRMLQFSTLQANPAKTSLKESNNSVLLELLNDIRFQPIPLLTVFRVEEELVSKQSDRTVEQFAVQGPTKTSVGDECMGCVRGWNHFCPVLKCSVPSSAYRAGLQPPASSFSATRIGLGLEPSFYANQGDITPAGSAKGHDNIAKFCPNYQPRRSRYLTDPSVRRDVATTLIEDAIATKSLLPVIDEHYNTNSIDFDSSSELSLRRGQKRPSDPEVITNGCNIGKRRYKCSHCSKVQSNPFGCISCRREKLVKELASRDCISPSATTPECLKSNKSLSASHNYDEVHLKPMPIMLRQTHIEDVDESKDRPRRDGQIKIGKVLIKKSWTPNAILPLVPKGLPTPKRPNDVSALLSESDDSSSVVSATSCSLGSGCGDGICVKVSAIDGMDFQDNFQASINSNVATDAHDLRKTRRPFVDSESHINRQLVAMKHKESANDLSRKCLSIACSGILIGMIRRDPLRLFAKPAPFAMEEYHKVIKDPIDFQTMRQKLFSNEYATLGSFINDAKRLCINACVFNSADSLYAKTAKFIYDSLVVMARRAQDWIAILKNTHASSFIANDDGDGGGTMDIFKEVESMWPGAVALLKNGSWLEEEAQSDFTRTKENEMAYYGALAIRRAAIAACESLAPVFDTGRFHRPLCKRSHIEDQILREKIDSAVSLVHGTVQLKEHPDWREETLLKVLKVVQRHRVEMRNSSETGCARCDNIQSERGRTKALPMLRSNANNMTATTKPRVSTSRSYQSTGLASRNARNTASPEKLESVARVACEAMVSLKGSGIHGWGLFSDHPFEKGDIVAEYLGEYISNAVADAREKYYHERRIQDYQFRISDSVIIDATLKGGYARYINHSCSPNCVAKIIEGDPPYEHLKRVIIVAERDIEATEELTYDYHFPLETDLENRVPCNCKSRHCRGFMNWDIPEKMKHKPREGNEMKNGNKR